MWLTSKDLECKESLLSSHRPAESIGISAAFLPPLLRMMGLCGGEGFMAFDN